MTPGTFPIEGDLAESWTQPTETTYIFKLRKGVRWHNKPPVNGRELTADDVKYTFDRFVTEKGNANRAMMAALDKVEVVDKYTVKFTLKEPYVWFLDMVSNPMALAIIPKEAVEKFGDLKKPESVIGTGPWMLDSYRPNVGRHVRARTRTTSCPGCPTSTRSRSPSTRTMPRGWPPSSPASTTSAMRRRAPSPAWTGCRSRTPSSRSGRSSRRWSSPTNQMSHIYMRTDKPPFNDVRVRRAISIAVDRQGILDAVYEGVGVFNPAVPAAFKEWALPVDQLGEGAQYYKHDPARAKKLLAEAGYPNGFPATISYATYGSHRRGRHAAARPEVPEGRRHRRQGEPAGVRRLHREHVLRQVRVHGLRPADAVPRPRQLPLRPHMSQASSRTRATSTTRWWPTCSIRQRRTADVGEAARGPARDPAASREAAVLRVRAVRASTSASGTARSRTTPRTWATTGAAG